MRLGSFNPSQSLSQPTIGPISNSGPFYMLTMFFLRIILLSMLNVTISSILIAVLWPVSVSMQGVSQVTVNVMFCSFPVIQMSQYM